MKLFFFYISTSVLFIVAAIPMQPKEGSSSVPNPNYVPKIVLGDKNMYANDRNAAKDMISNHYQGLDSGDDHKGARLAFAKKGWHDGKGPDDEKKQYLNFDYHQGNSPDSAKIGQTVTVSRDRPLPEAHFSATVPKDDKADMTKEMIKHYNALPPDQAKLVRSMKALGGWDNSEHREKAQFTYHHSPVPRPFNTVSKPVTIQRSMSFHIDPAVPNDETPIIKKRVRQEHDKLDEDHPLKQANYGIVSEGWHSVKGSRGRGQQVDVTLYKVKDKVRGNAEEDPELIGNFPVTLGQGRRSTA